MNDVLERTSVLVGSGPAGPGTGKSVPFVELGGGRGEGGVSGGADIERVYVSFVESGSGDYYCCTNNNRPCGGLRGAPCKHIAEMVDEAILQFGAARVAAYLGVGGEGPAVDNACKVLGALGGRERKEPPG